MAAVSRNAAADRQLHLDASADAIHERSKVFEELDLDSIDAIDLVARLQQLTGQRIGEAAMREVRTVGDIVDLVAQQLTTPS